jgi:hypothetical protein
VFSHKVLHIKNIPCTILSVNDGKQSKYPSIAKQFDIMQGYAMILMN